MPLKASAMVWNTSTSTTPIWLVLTIRVSELPLIGTGRETCSSAGVLEKENQYLLKKQWNLE